MKGDISQVSFHVTKHEIRVLSVGEKREGRSGDWSPLILRKVSDTTCVLESYFFFE